MIAELEIPGWGATILQYVVIFLLFAAIGHVARRLIERSVAKDGDRVLEGQFKARDDFVRGQFEGLAKLISKRFRIVDKNVEGAFAVSRRVLSQAAGMTPEQAKAQIDEWGKEHIAEREQLVNELREAVKLFPEALEEPRE